MNRLALGCASAALLLLSPAASARGQQAPQVLVLTDKNYKQDLVVGQGDVIEVRLLTLFTLDWTRIDDDKTLRESPGFPKTEERVGGNPTSVGAAQVRVHRYEVTANPAAPIDLKLMFCRKGDPALTRQRLASKTIVPPGPFSPDDPEKNVKEGMIYQVTVKPRTP